MKKTDLFKDRRNFFSKLFLTGAGSLTLLSLSGCGGSSSSDSTAGQLTDEQKDNIFYMYQEEKLARDVYITLGNLHPNACTTTFATIQKSEQRHIDAVQVLCEKYGIDISGVNEDDIGNFVLPVLQQLYDDLVAQGSTSLLAAYNVGVFIEELDIADIIAFDYGAQANRFAVQRRRRKLRTTGQRHDRIQRRNLNACQLRWRTARGDPIDLELPQRMIPRRIAAGPHHPYIACQRRTECDFHQPASTGTGRVNLRPVHTVQRYLNRVGQTRGRRPVQHHPVDQIGVSQVHLQPLRIAELARPAGRRIPVKRILRQVRRAVAR